MPDDVAREKVAALQSLGATVERVRPASIVDKKQNLARQRATKFGRPDSIDESSVLQRPHLVPSPTQSVVVTTTSLHVDFDTNDPEDEEDYLTKPRGFFADQFEASCFNVQINRSNFDAHFEGTGPEIWRQTNGHINAFFRGTGGTIAGIGQYIKSLDSNIVVALADPEGSGLYNKVKHGVMFDRKESEGTKRRHQVDTVVEGMYVNSAHVLPPRSP
ncbi:hypothetical protein H0H92_010770 [Tricholoma furcatifolium]|nr:hypothetical protein H0H92_010770 [Tricholoma furcatifolium]